MSAQTSPSPERVAVVIGASVAGLCAAEALSQSFDRVIIVEKDVITEDTTYRKGVPQGRHVHAVLARGQMNLERLFPGLGAWAISQGAVCANIGEEGAWHLLGAFRPRYRSALAPLGISRPLLERGIRHFALKNPKITLRCGLVLTAYLTDGARARVRGVRCRLGGEEGAEQEIAASLVVDASGRGSKTPRMLEALGLPVPEETVVTSKAAYASCVVRLAPDPARTWSFCYVQPSPGPGGGTRGAIIAPMEDGLSMATLIGMAGDAPPTDELGFLEFARSLPTPVIADALAAAMPAGPIHGYAKAENRLRHYDRLPRHLDGLVLMGDAVYALNPVYGQGMTVASMAALALGEMVARRTGPAGLDTSGISAAFQKKLTQVIALPWQMATGEDLRWPIPENVGRIGLMGRLLNAWVDRVQRASLYSAEVTEAFYRVAQMVDAPTALMRPGFVWKVLTARPPLKAVGEAGSPARAALAAGAP